MLEFKLDDELIYTDHLWFNEYTIFSYYVHIQRWKYNYFETYCHQRSCFVVIITANTLQGQTDQQLCQALGVSMYLWGKKKMMMLATGGHSMLAHTYPSSNDLLQPMHSVYVPFQ
jgi:hypothetical protein